MEIVQTTFNTELKNDLYNMFAQHAIEVAGMNGLATEPVSFVMRDGYTVIGAIVAQIFWQQLHIKYLAVNKEFRKQGIAKKLMNKMLEYGRNQGCSFVYVETLSFQAPDMYKKMGFKEDFKRDGFANNTSFHYLSMPL